MCPTFGALRIINVNDILKFPFECVSFIAFGNCYFCFDFEGVINCFEIIKLIEH